MGQRIEEQKMEEQKMEPKPPHDGIRHHISWEEGVSQRDSVAGRK